MKKIDLQLQTNQNLHCSDENKFFHLQRKQSTDKTNMQGGSSLLNSRQSGDFICTALFTNMLTKRCTLGLFYIHFIHTGKQKSGCTCFTPTDPPTTNIHALTIIHPGLVSIILAVEETGGNLHRKEKTCKFHTESLAWNQTQDLLAMKHER